MKVVIVVPNPRWYGNRPWQGPPPSVLLLCGILRGHVDLALVDANNDNLSREQVAEQLRAIGPSAVLVSGMFTEHYRSYHEVFRIAKECSPSVFTVLGGVYANLLPEESAKDPNLDCVFVGHAEGRLLTLLEHHPDHIVFRDGILPRHQIHLVDPDYSLIDVQKYYGPQSENWQVNAGRPIVQLITSYGCPYHCSFCAAQVISGKGISLRTPESVLGEVRYLRNRGVRRFYTLDDCLLASRPRIEAILEGFKAMDISWQCGNVSGWHLDADLIRKIKESGAELMIVSVESGVQRVLNDLMHKPLDLRTIPAIVQACKDVCLPVETNLVIGHPGETWDEIRESIEFAERMDFDMVHIHIATPLPGTDLYRVAKANGNLPEDFSFFDPRFHGLAKGYITTSEFTPGELEILRGYEWDRINFRTPERRQRMQERLALPPDQVKEHRRQTRLKLGKHY